MQPLSGVRVLDFSTLLPGPLATLVLAEAGAEVIKIERPGVGEDMRHYEPKWGDDSVNFALLNRGKASLPADLKDHATRDRLLALGRSADIVVEQFRPGVMDRLGLGYQHFKVLNPRIIYCSITGYGQSGPRAMQAGHDLNYIGDTGLLALSSGDPGHPTLPPALIADIAGGTYPAVVNILLALRQRDQTSQGLHLDIAMTDHLFTFMYWALGEGLVSGRWPENGQGLVAGGSPRYHLYETSDGKLIAAAPLEPKFWDTFCSVIELDPALRDDSLNPKATIEAIVRIIAGRPAAEWQPVFAKADCCVTIVQTLQQAHADPHFISRGLFAYRLSHATATEITALPVPVAPAFRAPVSERRAAPVSGPEAPTE